MIKIAATRHGFVVLIFGMEISYASYESHIGIGWTRSIVIGRHRYWLTRSWRIFASSTPRRGFRIRGR